MNIWNGIHLTCLWIVRGMLAFIFLAFVASCTRSMIEHSVALTAYVWCTAMFFSVWAWAYSKR